MQGLLVSATLATVLAVGITSTATRTASPSGEVLTRTVEIPEAGVAVTLAAGWRVWPAEEPGHPTEIWATDVAARQTCVFSLMEDVASAEAAAYGTVETIEAHRQHEVVERTFLNLPSSSGYECLVEDDTGLASLPGPGSLAAWQDTIVSSAQAQKRRASKPVVTAVGLPSGPAVRADWQRWSDGPATAWIFLDGDRRAALVCRSDDLPGARWLSIAETFEFLPAG